MEHGTKREVPASDWLGTAGGALHAEGVSLEELAARVGTPTHVFSERAITNAYRAVDSALAALPHVVFYAMKANGNPSIVRLLATQGAGIDAVSGGEVTWALRCGVPANRIVMSGVGKTDDELRLALSTPIRSIHVESAPELEVIEELARGMGVKARVGLRINPNVDPKTHPYIATGIHGTKFGLEVSDARALLAKIKASDVLELEAITSHIGSQLGDLGALREGVAITARFLREALDAGHTPTLLDVGGGWPITYGDEDEAFPPHSAIGAALIEGLRDANALEGNAIIGNVTLGVEPGRALVGDAGALLTRVLFVKDQGAKRFVVVDAAMTELIRPALYGAYHAIVPVRPRAEGEARLVDIVGPVCESGDFFAEGRLLGPVVRGDLILVRGTGAYGAAMASEYNARPRAAEVMVAGDAVRVVRARGDVNSLHEST